MATFRNLWDQWYIYFFAIQLYFLTIFLLIQWFGYDGQVQRVINEVEPTVQVLLDKVKNGTEITLEDVNNVGRTIKHWKSEYFQAIKSCKTWYGKNPYENGWLEWLGF